MTKLWLLLTIAFVDLIVAMVLASRGYLSPAYLFLLMAALVGGYAIFPGRRLTRDRRGRLQAAEFPYAGVLGAVGAVVILASAGYVAFATTRPAAMMVPPAMRASSRQAPAPPPAYEAQHPLHPSPDAAVIYKCVNARGHASFQSQRCSDGSEQAWVRDATPEPPPSRAQLAQQGRDRRAAAQPLAQADSGSGYFAPSSDSGNASDSFACESSRAADAAYRRQPLRYVTHHGLRQHGDAIQRACY